MHIGVSINDSMIESMSNIDDVDHNVIDHAHDCNADDEHDTFDIVDMTGHVRRTVCLNQLCDGTQCSSTGSRHPDRSIPERPVRWSWFDFTPKRRY